VTLDKAVHALLPLAVIGAATAGLLTGHLTAAEFIATAGAAAGVGAVVVARKAP